MVRIAVRTLTLNVYKGKLIGIIYDGMLLCIFPPSLSASLLSVSDVFPPSLPPFLSG